MSEILGKPSIGLAYKRGHLTSKKDLGRPASDAALREYCDRNCHQLLPIIAEKVHQEKVQQDKLKAIKARLNFKETSQYSESGVPSKRRNLKERLGSRHARIISGSPEPRHGHSESPSKRGPKRKTVFKTLENGVFHGLGNKEKDVSTHSRDSRHRSYNSGQQKRCQKAKVVQDDIGSQGRRSKSQVSKTTCPNHGKAVAFDQRNKTKWWKRPYKGGKEGGTLGKEKALAILMVQPRHKLAKQRITQTFYSKPAISFPPLGEEDGTEGPMVIEAKMGGNFVHRIYVDEGSSSKILYEHFFNRFRPEIRRKMIPATTPLVGFSRKIIWPLGQISLLVKIGDEEHSTSAWMNFMVVRSPSPYNGIIRRPGVKRIQAVPSTAHVPQSVINQVMEEKIQVAIHPEYPEQAITIGSTLTEEGQKQLCGLLRRNRNIFAWKPADMAGMKKLIAKLPMLTAPTEKEERILYLAVVKEAVSAVLMTERDGNQMRIYFVNRSLQGSKINYTLMEKLIIALVSASKRLKRYFQAYTIVVITDQPIRQILSNPEVIGRLLKWSFELQEHDSHYRPRASLKGQILADFIMKHPEDDPRDVTIEDEEVLPDPWMLFTDGSSCIDGSEAGLIIINPKGMEFTYALRFRFDATNNEAEYEALIGENKKADALSKIATTSFAHLSKQVLMEEVKEKSIDEKDVLMRVEEERRTWMTPIHEYLAEGILLEEKKKARAIRRKAGRYATIDGILYKKSFLGPWLRCVGPQHANYVRREIHEGSCSMHASPRSVVAKALRFTATGKLLLADYAHGCQKINTGMQRLPGSPPDAKKPTAKLNPHRIPMAILQMGVRNISFRLGYLVHRNNEASHAEEGGKLGPKWEGPYEVIEALGKGEYKLRDRNGNNLPRTWNVCNLKKCYMHEM
nr:reverse transcriptase domain-containing protein [Tanacetum cinerariifolium]